MNKIKNIILFTVFGFFIVENNTLFSMEIGLEKNAPKVIKTAQTALNIGNEPAADNGRINPAGKNWSDTIIKLLIKTTIAAFVTVVINPDIIKYLFSKINNKYAYEIKIQQLKIVNESLKIQLEQLRLHCRDKKIIKAMEETYLKSCIQIIELQKKYLERYAN
jgi:hypothetical protein